MVLRGQHKLFLGMAVGVGKTYRMLQEGQSRRALGHDVTIGLVETHGRPETAALVAGLELIPRRAVMHAGALIEELDLPAILRRAPGICLVDELAHTNTPGLEHSHRCEDVEELLSAGVNVYSTLNVQHLESVSARLEQATGVPIRETVPDQVIDDADEVVVVDLTPEALIARINDGKVFPATSVPLALERFFTKDNLDMLREMALMQVVEEVEAHRLAADVLEQGDRLISNAQARREHHFLGLVKPDPSANRIVRRAWEMSGRLGGQLDLLWVCEPHAHPDAERERQLENLRRLGAVFGAGLLVEQDRNLLEAVMRVVRRCGTTHVVMGIPHLHKRFGIPQRSLVDRLVELAPTLQLALVGDPPQADPGAPASHPGADAAQSPITGR